jgi:hypothetical protein
MVAGPGNTRPSSDYAASIPVKLSGDVYTLATGPPTSTVASGSAISFPRPMVIGVGIGVNNYSADYADQTMNTEFILPSAGGIYRITWHVTTDIPTQWCLFVGVTGGQSLDGSFVPLNINQGSPAQIGTSIGNSELVGDVLMTAPFANTIVEIRNFTSSGGAATIVVLAGGTNAQATSLIIQRIA